LAEENKAPQNRSITITEKEIFDFCENRFRLSGKVRPEELENKLINQDFFEVSEYLPDSFADLVILDPPYNLNKNFNNTSFREMTDDGYYDYVESFIVRIKRMMKPEATLYFCSDWKSSNPVYSVLSKHFEVKNRITWEREKGRGANTNWKNCSEDIWFCTNGKTYTFNSEAVKLKRKVLAPYRNKEGKPKDWQNEEQGAFRLTYPSNIWTDISVPFWSMPENTEHPTQKPEKLTAKLILASSNEGDLVFDPFAGPGTTAVTAKKLRRKYCIVEIDEKFSAIAEKRLKMAENDSSIQGYSQNVFWERNTLSKYKDLLRNEGENNEQTD